MSTLIRGVGILADAATDQMHEPWTSHDTQVLVVAGLGIVLVVVLIVWAKMHAFLALTISALLVGIFSGIPLADVTKSYELGVGGVLGYVGVLIALGAMLGKLLGDSGGADKIVDTLLHGSRATLPWKMALIAGIIGIPMFFEVGLVLLVPVVMLAVHRSKMPAMLLAIPALAGLSVLHGFVPPHPGPVAAVGILNADIGITLALGLLVAIPTVAICGPLFGRFAARWVPIGPAGAGLAFLGAEAGSVGGGSVQPASRPVKQGKHQLAASAESAPRQGARDPAAKRIPSFGWTLATVLSPVFLMLLRAAADLWVDPQSALYKVLNFIGDPVVALLIAVLLAMVTFGTAVGFSATTLGKKIGESLLPIVGVMLIVGAGGGFKQVLVDGGTSTAIAKIAVALSLSALVLGWIVAVLIRVATGSATVATVTAAGIVAPLAAGLPPAQLALVVLAVGAGSLFFSHVNDAGFWLVKEYFGMTVGETIKTWSVMETLISVVGLLFIMLLAAFL
ncbi:SLC13 family permease [Paeniglutamicibacter kerguelensis]|uniref:GntP family gluconate:H+ symporter n=1 Tax=Paeniglutamicibacter kerguelensis TaxID=254788 RepID=A0ABS4XCG1_9MICC|nr:SLC13 family permease [Paeniglutamicibacter kerguelensis]MBP2386155.1 GntP family gluconate:H+ symporter [Paeniglutamicibacter kerguelensis]